MSFYSEADEALYSASLNGLFDSPYGAPGTSYAGVDLTTSYKAVSGSYVDDSAVCSPDAVAPPTNGAPSASPSTASPPPAASGVLTDIIAKFYWNEKFQLLLERVPATPDEAKRRAAQIDALMGRFAAIAQPVVEQIVSEVGLPLHKRTIKPLSVGGIAGGDKYLARNLFVKLCSDKLQLQLYGGAHFAQKAAAHELKSLNALIGCAIPSLTCPLMCVFMCMGYRVVVISKLPISARTLCYGSADAGRTILTDPAFDKLIRAAATKLNLAPHRVREEAAQKIVEVCGPVDLEGHRGADARMYVCDVARLFPCTFPVKDVPGCHLYKLFRQEFVRANPVALSSDAFSHFGKLDAKTHNQHTRDAYSRLIEFAIPSVARDAVAADTPWTMERIKDTLHARGINLRYCGCVLLSLVVDGTCRASLLHEMMARAVKNDVYAVLRGTAQAGTHTAGVAAFLQRSFGSATRRAYWLADGMQSLRTYFEFAHTRSASINDEGFVCAHLTPLLVAVVDDAAACVRVLLRACMLAGVELDTATQTTINLDEPLRPAQIVAFRTHVKMMRFDASLWDRRPFADAEAAYLDAIERAKGERGTNDAQTIKQMLNLALLYGGGGREHVGSAVKWFETAIDSASALRGPESLTAAEIREQYVAFLAPHDLAAALRHIAQVVAVKRRIAGIETDLSAALDTQATLACVQGEYALASRCAAEALALKRAHATPLDCALTQLIAARVAFFCGAHDDAHALLEPTVSALESASHAGLSRALDLFAQNLVARGELERANDVFSRAAQLKSASLSELHVSTAATNDHWAACLLRAGRVADADALSQKALDTLTALCGDAHWSRGVALWNRAAVLFARGDAAAADAARAEALRLLATQFDAKHDLMVRAQRKPAAGAPVSWLSHVELTSWGGAEDGQAAMGFDISSLSPELLALLREAGVTQDDLRDPAKVETIFTLLMETLAEAEATPSTTAAYAYDGGNYYSDDDNDGDDNADDAAVAIAPVYEPFADSAPAITAPFVSQYGGAISASDESDGDEGGDADNVSDAIAVASARPVDEADVDGVADEGGIGRIDALLHTAAADDEVEKEDASPAGRDERQKADVETEEALSPRVDAADARAEFFPAAPAPQLAPPSAADAVVRPPSPRASLGFFGGVVSGVARAIRRASSKSDAPAAAAPIASPVGAMSGLDAVAKEESKTAQQSQQQQQQQQSALHDDDAVAVQSGSAVRVGASVTRVTGGAGRGMAREKMDKTKDNKRPLRPMLSADAAPPPPLGPPAPSPTPSPIAGPSGGGAPPPAPVRVSPLPAAAKTASTSSSVSGATGARMRPLPTPVARVKPASPPRAPDDAAVSPAVVAVAPPRGRDAALGRRSGAMSNARANVLRSSALSSSSSSSSRMSPLESKKQDVAPSVAVTSSEKKKKANRRRASIVTDEPEERRGGAASAAPAPGASSRIGVAEARGQVEDQIKGADKSKLAEALRRKLASKK